MTQKSLGRLARDAAKEAGLEDTLQTWEGIRETYATLKLQLSNYVSIGNTIDKAVIPFIEDQSRFTELCRILAKDIREISSEIDNIYSPYLNKTGPIQHNEFLDFLPLINELAHFGEKILDVIDPIASEINSMLEVAVNKQIESTTNGEQKNG